MVALRTNTETLDAPDATSEQRVMPLELFHTTRRRHSALDMLTPTEYENRYFATPDAA